MREIRKIGHKKQGGRRYLFSLFECDGCGGVVEKIRKDGAVAKFCSHKCYALNRNLRGAYKGGEVLISGYLYTYKPEHPNSINAWYVASHRLIAEQKLGRYLTTDEIAHHINGIKTDNHPDNIEVMTKSQHSKHHQNFRKCKIAQ